MIKTQKKKPTSINRVCDLSNIIYQQLPKQAAASTPNLGIPPADPLWIPSPFQNMPCHVPSIINLTGTKYQNQMQAAHFTRLKRANKNGEMEVDYECN